MSAGCRSVASPAPIIERDVGLLRLNAVAKGACCRGYVPADRATVQGGGCEPHAAIAAVIAGTQSGAQVGGTGTVLARAKMGTSTKAASSSGATDRREKTDISAASHYPV